jgi:hypothetical protein
MDPNPIVQRIDEETKNLSDSNTIELEFKIGLK